jgi:hypothetical protein
MNPLAHRCALGLLVVGLSACFTSHERYVVVDSDARTIGSDGFPGALFTFDRTAHSIEILAADARFVDPQCVVVDRDDSVLVVDMTARPNDPSHHGAVFRVDTKLGVVTDVFSSPLWSMPTNAALDPRRDVLYVVDRAGTFGAESVRGCVFALDLKTGASTVAYSDPQFVAPSAATVRGDGRLIVLDADAPDPKLPEQGILFELGATPADTRTLVRLSRCVSPLGCVPERDGSFLVLDANADPLHRGGPLGAIFRADPRSGETTLLASPLEFRDPVRGCLTDDGLLLFADANADPEGKGPDPAGKGQNITGPGALFYCDPQTGAVTLAATSPRFVNPVDVARLP